MFRHVSYFFCDDTALKTFLIEGSQTVECPSKTE